MRLVFVRWQKKIGWLLVCLLCLGMALVATLPVKLFHQQIAQSLGTDWQFSELTGTVWQGELSEVRYQQQAVWDKVEWQLQPLALLRGAVRMHIHPRMTGMTSEWQTPDALVVEWQSSQVRLENMQLHLPLPLLTPWIAPIQPYQLQGIATFTSSEFTWQQDNNTSIILGKIACEWSKAKTGLAPDADLGDYVIQLNATEKGVLVKVDTVRQAALELTGDGQGELGGRWQLGMQFNIPPALAPQLSPFTPFLGQPAADGRYNLRYQF